MSFLTLAGDLVVLFLAPRYHHGELFGLRFGGKGAQMMGARTVRMTAKLYGASTERTRLHGTCTEPTTYYPAYTFPTGSGF